MFTILQQMDVNIDEIQYIIDKYKSEQNIMVVTGTFSSGKSSFINCYLNKKEFLPYGTTECTPVLIDIFEGEEQSIQVRTIEGEIREEDYSKETIYEFAKYDAGKENRILSIEVPVADSGLQKGLHMIDTPGTNTILKEHEQITDYIIKKADVVLYLFNKGISKSDITHIMNIRQYTKNIIFILTHADEEDSKTGEVYSEKKIEELMAEAKKQISDNTGIDVEELLMLPVGSYEGFSNRTRINAIMELIEGYIRTQTQEKRKRTAEKKIREILKLSIDSYRMKKELLQKESLLENGEFEQKIKKYTEEQKKCEAEHKKRVEETERDISAQEELCKSELYRMLAEEKEVLSREILIAGKSERDIELQAEGMNRDISKELRKIIESCVSSITRKAYQETNDDLKKMVDAFEMSMPITLTTPEIKDLDDDRLQMKLLAVEKEMESNLAELNALKNSFAEQEKKELEKKILECENRLEETKDSLVEWGNYTPEYIMVENAGGGNKGKITGRVIGEIADIALLLWNPGSAAAQAGKGAGKALKAANETSKVSRKVLQVADKAKDVTTAVRYVKGVADKVSEAGKQVKDKKEKAEEVLKKIKEADDKRRKIIERAKDKSKDKEEDKVSLTTMLDMLSIGHWTEKLGGAIGEVINPTTMSAVEDEEKREEYESGRRELLEQWKSELNEIARLKNQLLEMDDFGKVRRLEQELKDRERALEEKKADLERRSEIQQMEHNAQQIRQHMDRELLNYESVQKEKGEKLICLIFSEAKKSIAEALMIDFEDRVELIQKLIQEASESAASNAMKIKDCDECIEKLSASIADVEKWLE